MCICFVTFPHESYVREAYLHSYSSSLIIYPHSWFLFFFHFFLFFLKTFKKKKKLIKEKNVKYEILTRGIKLHIKGNENKTWEDYPRSGKKKKRELFSSFCNIKHALPQIKISVKWINLIIQSSIISRQKKQRTSGKRNRLHEYLATVRSDNGRLPLFGSKIRGRNRGTTKANTKQTKTKATTNQV